jgi:hypothetical protein
MNKKPTIAEQIKAIEFMQGRIRDLPIARMGFDFQAQSEFEKLSGRAIDDELVGEARQIARRLNSSELSQAFDEFSAMLRDAAEIAAQDGIALPSCLELAEVIKNQDELDSLCGKANAELGLWAIALKAKGEGKSTGGRPKDADKQKALEIIRDNPNLKTAQQRELLERAGIYYPDTQIHKLRSEAKNLPK